MKLLVLGKSRAGKDTFCLWFKANTKLKYYGSLSHYLRPQIAKITGKTLEQVYEERHENRDLWREQGDEFRKKDPLALVRLALDDGNDIINGVRSSIEFDAIVKAKIVDLIVWIDSPVPSDKTLELSEDDAHIVVRNYGHLDEFYDKLNKLARVLKFDCKHI